VPGRYGGVIGGEGNCCASEVKTVELDGPLRGRILCIEVDGVVTHACVRKTAGISWGFHTSHRDLTAASTRPLAYLCLCTSRISFEGWEIMLLLERAGGRGFVRSGSHIEEWKAGAGVDTVDEDEAGVCKYAPDGVRIEEG
jgi:hypothetical protein